MYKIRAHHITFSTNLITLSCTSQYIVINVIIYEVLIIINEKKIFKYFSKVLFFSHNYKVCKLI